MNSPAGSGVEPQPPRHFLIVSMLNLVNLKVFYRTVLGFLIQQTLLNFTIIRCIRTTKYELRDTTGNLSVSGLASLDRYIFFCTVPLHVLVTT